MVGELELVPDDKPRADGKKVSQFKQKKDTYTFVDSQPLEKHPYLLVDTTTKTYKYCDGIKI